MMMSWFKSSLFLVLVILSFGLIFTNSYATEDNTFPPRFVELPHPQQVEGAVKIVQNLVCIRELAEAIKSGYYFDDFDFCCDNQEVADEIIKLVDEIFVKLISIGSNEKRQISD